MEQLPFRATIAPLPEEVERPLWSVMIPTYNCAGYLRETLASVLAQAPGPEFMQIEVVDDCSTQDDPAAVVKELGQGRVSFYRQPENVGYIKNFETCLQRSRGKLVHLLHGDDCVRDGFYRKLQKAFDEKPEIGAAFCRTLKMDEHGHWRDIEQLQEVKSGILSNWLERIAEIQRISTPSIVVRREVYEKLGGFDRRISCWGEDWEMWVRIAAQYPVWYEVEPLAIRRKHSTSLTGRNIRAGKNIQDVRKAIAIVKHYLPENKADRLSKTASKNYALYALTSARQFTQLGDISAAMNQIREALLCSSSLKVFLSSLKLLTYVLYVAMRSVLRPKNTTSAV
ncbi:glycosyltransferase [Microcoleus sp. K1-B6]|uniref:glycosyltransferase n=1 Tax=unclassified Microcoleus TaxID=2642155 RepID=UPI002FD53423